MPGRLPNKRWSDLSVTQQTAVIVGGALQVGLLAGALWDLAHRRPDEVRGDRRMWAAISFIDFFGPIAYFTIGRKGCCCCWRRSETEIEPEEYSG